jgi:LPS export ABC transporter permease LptG/LPS export ABC transporter permease LptF
MKGFKSRRDPKKALEIGLPPLYRGTRPPSANPMLKFFDRYVLREAAVPFGIGLLVYSFVLLMNQLLIFPELFIAQGVSLGVTLKLLFFLIPAILAFTVPMSVLMGVLAGLSRMSSDSEITAFKTLGIGHRRILRPLLVLAGAGWIVTSIFALWVAPAFNFKFVRLFAEVGAERVQILISPREFNDTLPGTTIYFQDLKPSREWADVFIFTGASPLEPRILMARTGRLNVSAKARRASLELHDVVQHSVVLDEPERYSVSAYGRVEEEVNGSSFFGSYDAVKRVREMDIVELVDGLRRQKIRVSDLELERARLAADSGSGNAPRRAENAAILANVRDEILAHKVEIHKKLALPFACWIFVFLGLPLGISTKKGGRTSGFTLSLVIILFYYIFITAGEKFAMDGRLPPWLGMWGANIVFALVGLRLFAHSAREVPFFAALTGRRLFGKRKIPAASDAVPASRRLRPALRFPNILDRYILRKYLMISAFALVSLLAISAIVTFFEQIDNVYRNHKPISLLLSYVWFRFPEFIHFGIPVMALTSTLLAFGLLAKSNELTAMKACGISIYRVVAPALIMALLLGFVAFQIQERILPLSGKRTEEIWNRLNDVPVGVSGLSERRWAISRGRDRIFHYRDFDAQRAVWRELSILDIDPARWAITRRIYASRAALDGAVLKLERGWLREFADGSESRFEKFAALDFPFEQDRTLFWTSAKDPGQMRFGELRSYIEDVRGLGFDTRRLRVNLNGKLTFPLVALIMTLLGLPFAFAMGKRGALVGVGISLLIAIAYWVLIGVFRSLGYVGALSVFLASWGPNLIFGLLGGYLLLRVRT